MCLQRNSHPLASLTYKPSGPPSSGIIDCGPYSNPNYGCSDEDADGSAAFLQALLFVLTGNPTYANNAILVGGAWDWSVVQPLPLPLPR
jgi:hypothetical protein